LGLQTIQIQKDSEISVKTKGGDDRGNQASMSVETSESCTHDSVINGYIHFCGAAFYDWTVPCQAA